MFYLIPDTTQKAIVCSGLEDDTLFILGDEWVNAIALRSLNSSQLTNYFISHYGAALAAERFKQSYGERSYPWIWWQISLICIISFGILFTISSIATIEALCIGIFLLTTQYLTYKFLVESIYIIDDEKLIQSIRTGILNLQYIQDLNMNCMDSERLSNTISEMQEIVDRPFSKEWSLQSDFGITVAILILTAMGGARWRY